MTGSQARRRFRQAIRLLGSAAVIASLALAWLVLPRGRLSGVPASVPPSWDAVGTDAPCLLETSAPEPRSVRVGCYAMDGRLYVHSHRFSDRRPLVGTSWVEAIGKNPNVRIQIEGAVYPLRANEVVDPELKRRILVPRGHDPVPSAMRLFWFSPVDSRCAPSALRSHQRYASESGPRGRPIES